MVKYCTTKAAYQSRLLRRFARIYPVLAGGAAGLAGAGFSLTRFAPSGLTRRAGSLPGAADLDEGHPYLAEPGRELCGLGAESVAQALDQSGKSVYGQPGLIELRWVQRQVQGGQLEQTEGVVADHDRSGGPGQPVLQLGHLGPHLLLGRLLGRPGPAPGRPPPGPGAPPGAGSSFLGMGLSPLGVQSVLIALPYVENRIREAGLIPPPGHRR